MTETAAEIITSGQDAEEIEETDDQPTVEEELRDLHLHVQASEKRLNKVANVLENNAGTPATKGDLAKLYRFLTGDAISSLADLVAACGAGFEQVFELIENNEEETTEDAGPSEEDIQVYTTFLANIEAFSNLSKMPDLPEDQKKAFQQMITLNSGNLDNFHDAYGEEVMKEAAAKKMAEARGGTA